MDCTIETCPVSESIYGYRPSVAANAFFVALFTSAAIVQTVQGIRHRTWTYCAAMVLGSAAEALGHAGRIMLHDDPFGEAGFNLQICLLTLAPAFLAAAIYLMLKHLVLATSPPLSRLPPRWYTYIFIACDLVSLVLQAAGGGTAATADGDMAQLDAGDRVMMTGLSFQVLTLLVFGALSVEFGIRCHRRRGSPALLRAETAGVRASARFRWFVAALATAYVAILARCVYRIVEMAGGWRNAVMQNEASFVALDSTLCSLAVLCLTVWHPGRCFNYRSVNRDELLKEKLQSRKNNKNNGEKQPPVVKDASPSDGSDAELGRV